ncbi:PTS sugar transporter subunit IIA [Methylobacterium sp. Leaf465]|uniref:PTS sugar transporter subunit IIA n=1 Tax=Methylobacterium sp. Leaf465 TaxID=1736385 RepID=UPI0006FAAA9A|nr:PTS sugar transporter subunit IIA [Methylobacterium sp. Leaf465]KQT79890.1 PTS sugar transporter subunit IIA [Methylobacterium sp. Leaf465]
MTVDDLLPADRVICGLRTAEKTALLDDLARRAALALGREAAPIRAALAARESLGSTGIGDGIALPHARLDGLDRPFGLLARLRDPLDFEAIDGCPVDLVALLLLPADPRDVSVTALACIARRLRDPDVAVALRTARDVPGLHAALRRNGLGAGG